ncbi:universal stress protein [Streptomyces sp. NPDC056844]|uniref:universal stress protein n=1 Tax=unclassified Streptomyces TaxID=2593676 RepID=UPI0036AD5E3A
MSSPPMVVGADGSESGLPAADRAADEALLHGSPLRPVYASLWQRYEGAAPAAGLSRPDERVTAENIVGSTAERIRRRTPDLRVTTEVLPKDAAGALPRQSRDASAVVPRGGGSASEGASP